MAQSVRHPILDLSSGHDLQVCEFQPCIGLWAYSAELAWDSLSLPLSLPLPHMHTVSLSLKINKLSKKAKSCKKCLIHSIVIMYACMFNIVLSQLVVW